jgi:DNA-binding response OmpR family regulator
LELFLILLQAMSHRVLLVDDDTEFLELLRDYLEKDEYSVVTARDGMEGYAAAISGLVDIVVLDVMMPGISGAVVLAKIRATSNIPVLMLTARGDDADRIAGFDLGADDYVPKPASAREISARLTAILKRAGTVVPAIGQAITIGPLTIWPAQRRIEREGQTLTLTSTEYNFVELLVRKAGHPVTKMELSQEGLGRPLSRYDRSVDVHMSNIRHKLGVLSDGRSLVQTVIRKGYQLIVE